MRSLRWSAVGLVMAGLYCGAEALSGEERGWCAGRPWLVFIGFWVTGRGYLTQVEGPKAFSSSGLFKQDWFVPIW